MIAPCNILQRIALSLVLLGLVMVLPGGGRADLIGHGAPVRDIVISGDGRHAITAGFDDLLILWDLENQEARLQFVGHAAGVNAAAFLPDRVASVGDDGTLRLWDRKTAKLARTIAAHEKKAVAVAASPDGKLLATGSWDRTAALWNADGALVRRFDRHRGSVNAVTFSPDGKHVYSADYEGTIWRWSVRGEEDPLRLTTGGFPINDMELTPDGRKLVVGSADSTVRLWDVGTQSLTRELKAHEGAVLAVAISPDGGIIASGSTDGYLMLWEGDEAPRRKLPVKYYRAVWSIDFSPDGKIVYAAGVDRIARGWFVSDGSPISGETVPFQPIDRGGEDLALSDDEIERGGFHFRKCAVCHTLRDDGTPRAGPSLQGLFGRRVGTYPGYLYSQALISSDIIWTEETVSKLFEIGPDELLPGTKMPLQKLPKPEDRAALIAFLKARTQ